ncbi:PREDICTED: mitochondrial import inner membrane translocase subunit Tim21 [Crocodylus porosus]|uniref:Mitochondrial import inner membrane translocase subunit Tim21 n=1 Tax=Crocodylus porosus TaxID=8502 RepID=A0A7M4ECU7_CROPO|nr:PREDICTED: mitochondrial import inner membrane translocase subunit Tim21 [Crocodylus porosus]
MFSASLMRVIQCSEKLQLSPGKWFLARHGKVFLRTWSCFSGRHELVPREGVRHPRIFLQGAKQSLWTQKGSLRAENNSKQVSVQRSQKEGASLSAVRKVKEAGRDFTYFIVVLIGIGVTGGLFYVIFKELFSSSSPSKIYGDAFKKCRAHPEVISVFGEPIKGYGETTRRGRRPYVSHIEYVKDELKYMRLKFYIEGSERGKQGTVHVEVKENPESGRYEFRYIFVDVDTYPRRTIVIEDNR